MLPAAHRLKRSVDFSAAVRAGRRSGKGAVVVHLTVPTEQATPKDQTMASTEQQDSPVDAIVMSAAPAVRRAVSAPPTRAGFVVSKAVGNAVTRNLVKRRLRHLVAERIERLPAGSTLVVRAQPSAAERSYEKLGLDLDVALAAATRGRQPRPEPR